MAETGVWGRRVCGAMILLATAGFFFSLAGWWFTALALLLLANTLGVALSLSAQIRYSRGAIFRRHPAPAVNPNERRLCYDCQGTGMESDEHAHCRECDGRGWSL